MSLDYLGKGISFPLHSQSNGQIAISEDRQKIRQSIWLILGTAKGERLMRPEFGCGAHDLMFEPNSASLRGLVGHEVQSALIQWEPRIRVDSVSVETAQNDPAKMLVSVEYTIRDKSAPDNIVYPFSLYEGSA